MTTCHNIYPTFSNMKACKSSPPLPLDVRGPPRLDFLHRDVLGVALAAPAPYTKRVRAKVRSVALPFYPGRPKGMRPTGLAWGESPSRTGRERRESLG